MDSRKFFSSPVVFSNSANDAGRARVGHAGKGLLLGGRQRLPLAVKPVGQVRLVVAPAAAALGLHQRQILVQALELVGVARLEDVALDGQLRLGPPAREILQPGLFAPHAPVKRGEEEVGLLGIADDPEVNPRLHVLRMLRVKEFRLRPR